MANVSVDLISDVVCPWCWLGLRHWVIARSLVPDIKTETILRPFQLDSAVPAEGVEYKTYMKAKFGTGPDNRFSAMKDHLEKAGPAVGITFKFSGIPKRPNTLNAHRLIHWAQGQELGEAMADRLFKAFFNEHSDIGDKTVLARLSGEVGLEPDIVSRLLDTDRDAQTVLDQEQYYRQLGVQGVPCFIFNGAFAVSGAEDPEVLADAIRKAADQPAPSEERP